MIITIRTDNPLAEVGIFDTEGGELAYKKWQAHRELSSTLLSVAKDLLKSINKDFKNLEGVVFYKGPGSFTGLRIGASFANALELQTANENGENWVQNGIKNIKTSESKIALPFYGSEAHTTTPKK